MLYDNWAQNKCMYKNEIWTVKNIKKIHIEINQVVTYTEAIC